MNEVLYNTQYLQLKSTPSKNGRDWVYAHRPNANDVVVILPYTDEEVLFLIEERPPIQAEGKGKYTIACPAGLVGDERIGETIEDALEAELLEEAGLQAAKINIKAQKVSSSSGCTSETCTIALAYIKDKTPVQQPVNDNGVIVDRVWIKKSDILSWFNKKEKEGYVLTAQTLAALMYLIGES
ncbi:MAG: NUDIX domain-containing protein [Muribaculaceae bacterium]|nr:NUDIX domain-containing protein [Muribaculaceae bacterium]